MPHPITPVASPEDSGAPLRRSAWRWLRRIGILLFLMIVLAIGTVLYVYHQHLKPRPNEQGEMLEWTYLLHTPWMEIPISIPRAIAMATSPTAGPWLSGFSKKTSRGELILGWDKSSQSLLITCKACQLLDRLSPAPLVTEQAQLSIHQNAPDEFSGFLTLGKSSSPIAPASFALQGRLQLDGLSVKISANEAPIASIFYGLASNLEEVKRAHITGDISLDADVRLPNFSLQLSNVDVRNFTVSGLGTEKLINSVSACGPASNLPMNSWMVRSIMAVEDQRFEQHPGYDLQELLAALDANQQQGATIRGGSTISQQTAKLLFTNSDRTLSRKLREILYAIEMEQTLGKTRIMQLYLDNVPLGIYDNGRILCGVQTAARHYFNVDASKLKPEQAIWLASMLHSPVAEARSWQRTGRINLGRALWVAQNVRNAPNSGPRARQSIINTLRRDPSLGMKPQTPQQAATP